jgi:hypothetical protein
MNDGLPTGPRPLDYQRHAPAAPRPLTLGIRGQGTAGVLSVGCFALFVLCCVGAVLYAKIGIDPRNEGGGLGAIIAMMFVGAVLLPIGVLSGFVGLTYPPEQRAASVVGLMLNGAVVVLALVARFG